MFKLIGAAIIIIATTWAGFEAAKKLSMRPRQLRQLKVAMQSLEAEIMYRSYTFERSGKETF